MPIDNHSLVIYNGNTIVAEPDLEQFTKNYWNISKVFYLRQNSAISVDDALKMLGNIIVTLEEGTYLQTLACQLREQIIKHGAYKK